MDTKILDQIKSKFTYPPENWDELSRLWETSSPISFYSWECPPRQVQENPKFGRWVNFDVNIGLVVKGKKLDEYTELPRLTTQPAKEKWFMDKIVKKNSRASYTKIVADTNAVYLFVKSRKILGNEKIAKLSEKFRSLLEKEANYLFGKDAPKIILFTDIQKRFKTEYDLLFDFVLKSFKREKSPLVPEVISKAWMDCMVNHIGLSQEDKAERFDILKRAIASYSAEGMIFELASRSRILPNPIWANWEEKPNLARTIDLLRNRYGLEPIPKIYFVKE